MSRRLLYVALAVAAHDRRITDQAWRGLDAGRKELLLPLRNEDLLREGAQHVAKFKLTQASTREYVSEVLKAAGGKGPVARITPPRIRARVNGLWAILGKPGVLRRLTDQREDMEPAARSKMADEIDQLKDVLAAFSRTLRGTR